MASGSIEERSRQAYVGVVTFQVSVGGESFGANLTSEWTLSRVKLLVLPEQRQTDVSFTCGFKINFHH